MLPTARICTILPYCNLSFNVHFSVQSGQFFKKGVIFTNFPFHNMNKRKKYVNKIGTKLVMLKRVLLVFLCSGIMLKVFNLCSLEFWAFAWNWNFCQLQDSCVVEPLKKSCKFFLNVMVR